MNFSNNAPRVSINQMIHYNSAHAAKRHKIAEQAKLPKSHIVLMYRRARIISRDYFCSGFNRLKTQEATKNLRADCAKTDWQIRDRDKSAEAVDKLLQMPISIPGKNNLHFQNYKGRNPLLTLEGTNISVYPDLVIKGTYRGENIVGLVKFHFSSGSPMNEEDCSIGAMLLQDFAKKHLCGKNETVSAKHCLYIDPFAGLIINAPKSTINRWKIVKSSCKEFGMWWNAA